MRTIERKPGCIQAALTIIGDKWTALIIRDLYFDDKRFSELESSLDGISPRTLSQRLSKLEISAVIEKKVFDREVSCTKYSLTQKGRDFAGILEQMAKWGEKYHTYS